MASDPPPKHAAQTQSSLARLRRRLYEVLEIGHGEDAASRFVDAGIVALILLNIAAFVAETDSDLHAAYKAEFDAFEILSVALFSIEYLLRLWTAVEVPYFKHLPPWKARLKLATRPALLIDLAAILPFYLAHFFYIDLRMLRALRLLRFLKLSRYSPAMHSLIRVISNERKALIGAGLLLVTAVLFASTGIYYLEGHVQPEQFGSVPKSSWWAIATLTTVGYGDVTPVTAMGRLFGGIVMVTGLCILALPVAIISAGFAQEVNRRDFVVTWSLMSRIPMLAELDAKEVAMVMPLLHAHNMPPNVEVLADEKRGRGHLLHRVRKREAPARRTRAHVLQGRVLRASCHARRRASARLIRDDVEVPAAQAAQGRLSSPAQGEPGVAEHLRRTMAS